MQITSDYAKVTIGNIELYLHGMYLYRKKIYFNVIIYIRYIIF